MVIRIPLPAFARREGAAGVGMRVTATICRRIEGKKRDGNFNTWPIFSMIPTWATGRLDGAGRDGLLLGYGEQGTTDAGRGKLLAQGLASRAIQYDKARSPAAPPRRFASADF